MKLLFLYVATLLLFASVGALPTATDSLLEQALSYVTSIEGTKYGWWRGGAIPPTAPAWAADAPVPSISEVRSTSVFCAGIPNLMLRVVNGSIPCDNLPKPDPACGQCCGGTGAYGRAFKSVAQPFDMNKPYPRGTLLGRPYVSVNDQGHTAVLLGEGKTAKLLQSYVQPGPDCPSEPCDRVTPGVNANLTLEQAYNTLPFCEFTYAVEPQDWLISNSQPPAPPSPPSPPGPPPSPPPPPPPTPPPGPPSPRPGCPGGDFNKCMALCPMGNWTAYGLCVAACGENCFYPNPGGPF